VQATQYRTTEGRIGPTGQAINRTINGGTTPWIWSVIEFDSSGNLIVPIDHAMFPTYSIYWNGNLVQTCPQFDCYHWQNKGHASTSNMQFYSISTQGVFLGGSAGNPLEPEAGPIDWNVTVVIDESDPSHPKAHATGQHTCYPAHIVIVNGQPVYS
jgi:hypothetical protein